MPCGCNVSVGNATQRALPHCIAQIGTYNLNCVYAPAGDCISSRPPPRGSWDRWARRRSRPRRAPPPPLAHAGAQEGDHLLVGRVPTPVSVQGLPEEVLLALIEVKGDLAQGNEELLRVQISCLV